MKNQLLIDKLKAYEDKLKKVEEFVNKVPVCSEYIIKNEIIEQRFNNIGDKYKSIYFDWDLQRSVYIKGKRDITNYRKKHKDLTLTKIYLNVAILYDRHEKYGLEEIADKVFFYDKLNTTFYVTDDELENTLEALNNWYIIAKEKACIDNKKEKLANLDKQREQLIKDC